MRISDWSSDVCSSDLADLSRYGEIWTKLTRDNGYILLAVHRVGNRIALDRCTEPRLPENLSGARIDSFEVAIGIPDKHELTCGRERRRGEGNRSEEHTSELQSLMRISYAVFCLIKKK